MPTKGGLDEFNRKMEWLRALIANYDRAIKVIKGEKSEDDFELYKLVLEEDKKIWEGLNAK
jgi:hypothetical protein